MLSQGYFSRSLLVVLTLMMGWSSSATAADKQVVLNRQQASNVAVSNRFSAKMRELREPVNYGLIRSYAVYLATDGRNATPEQARQFVERTLRVPPVSQSIRSTVERGKHFVKDTLYELQPLTAILKAIYSKESGFVEAFIKGSEPAVDRVIGRRGAEYDNAVKSGEEEFAKFMKLATSADPRAKAAKEMLNEFGKHLWKDSGEQPSRVDDDVSVTIDKTGDKASPMLLRMETLLKFGELRFSLEELKTLIPGEFEKMRAENAEQFDLLARQNAKLFEQAQTTQNAVSALRATLEDQARAQAEAERKRQNLENIRGSIDLLGTLVGFADPKLGREVQVVGQSTFQAYMGVNNLIESVAKDGLLSFGSAAATGNIIGAVMQVFSLFGGSSGPSPEQLILDEIAKVREDIASLRQEMHERFDRIDEKLDQIYSEMLTRFDRIDYNLGILNDNVQDIQKTLVGLQADLNRVERNLFTFFDESSRQDLRLAINGWISYHERTGLDMTYAEYSNAATGPENQFQTWATILSKDQLRAGPNNPSYADTEIFPQLTNYPLPFNINYLAQFPVQKLGLPALATSRLANPRDWSISADAYRQLSLENLLYANQIIQARFEAIYNTGVAIKDALRNITKRGSNANFDLWNALKEFYNPRLAPVAASIKTIEDDYYKADANKLRHNGVNALNIFAGANQSIQYAPSVSNVVYTDGSGQPVSSGSVLSRFYIPEPYAIADYMTFRGIPNANLGRVSLRVTHTELTGERVHTYTDWHNYMEESNDPYLGTGTGQYRYFKDEFRYLQLKFNISLIWQNSVIAIRTVTSPETQAHRHRYYTNNNNVSIPQFDRRLETSNIESDTPAWVRSEWELVLRPNFEAASSEIPPTDTEREQRNKLQLQVASQVERVLGAHQINLYQAIKTTLADSTGASGLHNNAKLLSGAKELWSAYISLGMARSLEDSDPLRASLYGDWRILDMDAIKSLYDDAIVLINDGQSVPKVEVQTVGLERSNALHDLITEILNAIQAGTFEEGLSLIEVTLLQMDIYCETRYVPSVADKTGSVVIARSGLLYNRATGRYSQRFTLRNISGTAINGPVSLVFDPKDAASPLPVLANPDGEVLYWNLPRSIYGDKRSPYINVGIGADNVLSPNENATITVEIVGKPVYVNRVLAGVGDR